MMTNGHSTKTTNAASPCTARLIKCKKVKLSSMVATQTGVLWDKPLPGGRSPHPFELHPSFSTRSMSV